MGALAVALGLVLLASPSPAQRSEPSPAPSPGTSAKGPVILFLVDNSASLPPLDPDEKRVAALEKMFTFLQGQPYRLILFGGRREIFVDDASRYRNNGLWTDFYFAFEKSREVAREYPKGTEFRIIFLTDAVIDPDPEDWKDQDVPPGADLKTFALQRSLDLLREMKLPLYVILVGEPPAEGVAPGSQELAPSLILQMVQAANGAKASPAAQSLAAFFGDDGVLLKKFVFRVAPNEGLKKIAPVVRRIAAPPSPAVEFQFLGFLVLPLFLFLFLMLGILVRSFPGPGDLELVELGRDLPVHIAIDRLHKVQSGGWSGQGLSLVGDAKEAVATIVYQTPAVDLVGTGLDVSGLDPIARRLLPMGLDDLRRALDNDSDQGTKEEKIYALNLDYMAKNFDSREAERILASAAVERRRISALDFLRAKTHLLTNESLRNRLTEPRVILTTYGKDAERKELTVGGVARIGRYGFVVKDISRGGRKDVKLVLYYDRVPSLLGLKTILPDFFQRIFRLRRSSQRFVT
jgi:hypothetical protein